MIHTDKPDNSELISILNGLVETCKDGEKGFRTAAEGIANSELATLFLNYAEQRGSFAAELQAEVRRLGGDPETGGTALGAVHRGWIDIKSAVAGKEEGAVIAEAERGEDHAVREYREALEKNLPTTIQTVVENQYIHVRDAHDHIRALERLQSDRSAPSRVRN
ncbi:MAG: PA2169 family four-helix-bundle protein [Gemmatimonadota bacterium]